VIRYGDTVTGTISSEVYALFYQFSGKAGDQVEIAAARLSGDLDTVLVLHDAADNALPNGENDDATGASKDSRLSYTLPTDGTYIIAVTRFGVRDGTTIGDFKLSLARTNAGF
ncbi:MAG: PPC domain-containing protein, partial [Chloroflexota bacterium]